MKNLYDLCDDMKRELTEISIKISRALYDLDLPMGTFSYNGKIYLPNGKEVENLDGETFGYLLTLLNKENEIDDCIEYMKGFF